MDNNLTNIVQSSKRYDDFKLLGNNRVINKSHVEQLKRSIEDSPQTLAAQPIMVNQNLEVIDGQHRLQACRELDFPVYFTIVPSANIQHARNLNVNSRNWSLKDFVSSYAESGNEHYKRYEDLMSNFDRFNHSVILVAISISSTGRGMGSASAPMRKLREGNLKLPKSVFHKAERQLSKLEELIQSSTTDALKYRVYQTTLLRVMNSDEYSQARMKSKLSLFGHTLAPANTPREAARNLEDVYNYRQRKGLARFTI